MRGIFISQAVLNSRNGGGQFVKSLIGLLKSAIGEDNLTVVSLPDHNDTEKQVGREAIDRYKKDGVLVYEEEPSKLQKMRNVLDGCPSWVSKKTFDSVISIMNEGQYDFAFLGFSTYEYLMKHIKRDIKIPVYVMYQGIAPNTKKCKLVHASRVQKFKALPSYLAVFRRERVNALLADCNIVHNKRERDVFYHYYHKEPDLYLPVFMRDYYREIKGVNPGYNGFSLLFVGSGFKPNIWGITWFAENVMSNLSKDIHLYIVGNGTEILRTEELFNKDNISVIGRVEELHEWYGYADLVIEPIFEGDGMKTKTVEAMMYGKTILGSDEAFCGYEGLDEYLCNTAEEYIEKINFYKSNGANKINPEIRRIYEEKYSEKAMVRLMQEALEKHSLARKS